MYRRDAGDGKPVSILYINLSGIIVSNFLY
jgi:hypothetical protein